MDINIGPDGDFALTLPTGRVISIPNSPHAVGYLHSILFNEQHSAAKVRIAYPTQSDVAKFMKAQARERKEQVFKDYGVDMSALVIDI